MYFENAAPFRPMMRFPLDVPDAAQVLTVQTGTWGDNPTLLADSQSVPASKDGLFVVPARTAGQTISVQLKNSLLDTVPVAVVNEQKTVRLLPALKVWDYAWLALPLLILFLLVQGGALGGLIGAVAAYGNVALFRGLQADNKPAPVRYALTFLVTLAAVALHRGLVFTLRGALPPAPR